MKRAFILLALLAVAAGDRQQKLRELAKIPTVQLLFRVECFDTERLSAEAGLRATNAAPDRSEAQLLAATRTATNAAPWLELGDFYFAELWRMTGSVQTNSGLSAGDLIRVNWGQVTNRVLQAVNCYTKAIEVAPREPAVYLRRAVFFMFSGPVIARNQLPKDVLARLAFNSLMIADVCQAARLRPDDANLQAGAVYLQLAGLVAQTGKRTDSTFEKVLTPATKLAIAPFRERLDVLSKHADPKIAASACERLALLETMLHENDPMAEALLERAIHLNPALPDQTWDFLLSLPFSRGDYGKLVEYCAARMKAADTPRNRLLLAKAHWEAKEFDKCGEQLRLLLQRQPQDFAATAGLAALAIRQGNDAKAAELLAAAGKLITAETVAEQQADFHVLEAIQAAVTGNEREAQRLLSKARRIHPDNKHVQQLSDALMDF